VQLQYNAQDFGGDEFRVKCQALPAEQKQPIWASCYSEGAIVERDGTGLPPLEEPCRACNGTGDSPSPRAGEMRASFNCSVCKGHKVAPTPAGRELLDFLKRRLGLTEQEVRRSIY
jgi:hypothetical protein